MCRRAEEACELKELACCERAITKYLGHVETFELIEA